jgi:hypothetical protein
MNRVAEFAVRSYLGIITAAPVIGANYNVWENYTSENTAQEFATDAVAGAFCGAVLGILSPVVALGIPAYVALKVANNRN